MLQGPEAATGAGVLHPAGEGQGSFRAQGNRGEAEWPKHQI